MPTIHKPRLFFVKIQSYKVRNNFQNIGQFAGKYLICASNEVINIVDLGTSNVTKKFYDNEASYGFVTVIETFVDTSGLQDTLIAVGFSTGVVLVYNFNEVMESKFEQNLDFLHKFNFHKNGVSALAFDKTGSVLASGGSDTYIVVYDIIEGASLYKLMGHKDRVTQLRFHRFSYSEKSETSQDTKVTQSRTSRHFDEMLVSASKDTTVKIWNLESQFCAQTVMETNQKAYSFVIYDNLMLIGAEDEKIHIYKCGISQSEDQSGFQFAKYCTHVGHFNKTGSERVIELTVSTDDSYLCCTSADGNIEIFTRNDDVNIYKKLLRDAKKQNKKKRTHAEMESQDDQKESEKTEIAPKVDKDQIQQRVLDGDYDAKYMFTSKCYHVIGESKVRSSVLFKHKKNYRMINALHSNEIFVNSIKPDESGKKLIAKKMYGLGHSNHRGVLRCVESADNDTVFLTSSSDCVKVWNFEDRKCIKSIDVKNVVSMLLLPPNKHVLLGTKDGSLYLYTIASNECIQVIDAHNAEIWGLDIHMNPQTSDADILIASGSADKTLKLWSLELITTKANPTPQLQLVQKEEIETTDEVMGVKFTPDGKFLCFSLLDSTIKVIYVDTHKLFLSLYGHNLPILSFDISSDSTMLLSASADKNVKLWGLDFGDCHKSIFAHDDSITTAKFVKDTHYFFTGSKDGVIKYYDGDSYDEVQVFEQSFGHVWALTVSHIGDYVFAVGADQAIRIFRQTKEQLFLVEEREKRLEKMMMEDGDLEMHMMKPPALDQFSKDKVMQIESETALKGSLESVKYGEALMEAINISDEFRKECENYQIELENYEKTIAGSKKLAETIQKPAMPKPDWAFENRNIFEHVMHNLKTIRRSELENTLKFLNFTVVKKLLYYLEYYIRNKIDIELTTKVLIFFIKGYQMQIYGCEELKMIMTSVHTHLSTSLTDFKEKIGINMSAIKLMSHQMKYLDDKVFDQDVENVFENQFDTNKM